MKPEHSDDAHYCAQATPEPGPGLFPTSRAALAAGRNLVFSMIVGVLMLPAFGVTQAEPVLKVERERVDPAWREAVLKSRPKPEPSKLERPLSPLEQAIRWAEKADPKERRQYTLHLQGQPLDLEKLQHASAKEHASLIAEFKQVNARQRAAALQQAEKLFKAKPVAELWLTNTISVELAAGSLIEMLDVLDIVDVSEDVLVGPDPEGSYNGVSIRKEMGSYRFMQSGYDGSRGGRGPAGSNPVRVGVIEPWGDGHPDWYWPGWQSVDTGLNRIREMYSCWHWPCFPTYTAPSAPSGFSHSMVVTWLTGGSIEDGQDPNVTNGAQQERHSGVAPGTDMIVFRTLGSLAIATAIEKAVEERVDIVNMSLSFSTSLPETICSMGTNFSGLNEAIREATRTGMLFVGSGGNQPPEECGIGYPNLRPEVMAIAPLFSRPPDEPYNQLERIDQSSIGGIPMWVGSEGLHYNAGMTLAAPGCVSLYPLVGAEAGQYDDGIGQFGACASSIASPIVAGSAALLKHALSANGWNYSKDVAGRLFAGLAVLGDKWRGFPVPNFADPVEDIGVNERVGFGRLKMFPIDADSLPGPTRYAVGTFDDIGIQYSRTIDINPDPFVGDVTHFKFAMIWFENDYINDVADIVVELIHDCPGDGIPEEVIAYDYSFNLNKSITVRGSNNLTGRCLRVRATGYEVDTSRDVHFAYYFHGDNPVNH